MKSAIEILRELYDDLRQGAIPNHDNPIWKEMKDVLNARKQQIYLVYSNTCCEDEETCSCHDSAKDFEGAFFDEAKANEQANNKYKAWVEPIEVTE